MLCAVYQRYLSGRESASTFSTFSGRLKFPLQNRCLEGQRTEPFLIQLELHFVEFLYAQIIKLWLNWLLPLIVYLDMPTTGEMKVFGICLVSNDCSAEAGKYGAVLRLSWVSGGSSEVLQKTGCFEKCRNKKILQARIRQHLLSWGSEIWTGTVRIKQANRECLVLTCIPSWSSSFSPLVLSVTLKIRTTKTKQMPYYKDSWV